MNWDGNRSDSLEDGTRKLLALRPSDGAHFDRGHMRSLVSEKAVQILHREMVHSGLLEGEASYSMRLLGCAAVSP